MPTCPPGPPLRHGAFVSSTAQFLSPLGHSYSLWTPPGAAVSPPGSSGSSGAFLLGEVSFTLCSNSLRSCSDTFSRLFDRFLASSSCLDTPVVSASTLVSYSSPLASPLLSPSSSTLEASWLRRMGRGVSQVCLRRHLRCADYVRRPRVAVNVSDPVS